MKIKGYANTSDLDHYRHIVVPGAFDQSMREKGLSGPKGIRLLIQHDRHRIGGAITKLEQRNRGLWIEADLDESISYAKDMAAAIRATKGLSFSVGFYVKDADLKTHADVDEYLEISRGELFEVSVVTFPGNDHAIITEYDQ